MSEILDKVCKTIEKHNLLTFGDSVLCALSGGADSVCLLRVLCLLKEKYDLKIFAAHINHMLRGESADSDEEFAKELCKNFDVPFYSKKIDVLKYAKEHSQSTEEAGREVRYNFFYELCDTYNINKIATAHNLNDNTETVVMRFIRGTGINGLSGIPYKNNNIIRPILDLSRKEIEAFLKDENISFVTDKTNFEPVYFRNKVR
ncbi:MAG: tRNA lysidine(34) synthetase TilS, partial [Clostridia bacterium]|nr:tRNA lysidine(34) synthetase TilS [Clostridia bacterium]